MGGKNQRSYTEKEKLEALTAITSKTMTIPEISIALGVPKGTLYTWYAKSNKANKPKLVPVHTTPVQSIVNEKHDLEWFVNMLHSLVSDYEKIKTELHQLKKSAESWKVMAGKLNEQLQHSNGITP